VAEMTKRDATVAHHLNEAYALERRAESALRSHVEVTTRPEYAQRLQQHLAETRLHARRVEQRIKQLGATPEAVSLPGSTPEGLVEPLESAQGVIQRATAAVQHSLHAMRRTGEQQVMLGNARAEFREEAEEIATYRALGGLATALGDSETAKLAREILREEERMAAYLGELIPQLAIDVVHDEVPVSEIEGPAARRTAAAGAARGAASRTSARAGGPRRSSTRGGARARSGVRRTSASGGRRARGRRRR
jgi:ferritin-like metal-binding protein YciE